MGEQEKTSKDEGNTRDEEESKDSDSDTHESKDEKQEGQKPDAEKKEGDDSKDEAKKPKGPPLYKRPVFIITVSILLVVLLVGGIVLWLILRQYVWTDDAYVDGHVIQVSPQIAAPVQKVDIYDNEFVHRGDLLVELDPTDYEVALTQAKAQVSQALGKLDQAQAQIESAKAAIPEALAYDQSSKASLDTAAKDLHRYQTVDPRARTKQQLDNAGASFTNAQARLAQAEAQIVTAKANVQSAIASKSAAEGNLQAAYASQKRAEVNLGYCRIFAPSDGRVTERTVEAGNYVMAGQALFMLVNPKVWVTANFKETQLTYMRPGQEVTIKVDAFPRIKFRGKVDSIQAGSGSRFSVLPAENATGNFVKIVQRVPVKIYFEHDANTNNAPMLSPGLSVTPRVKVR